MGYWERGRELDRRLLGWMWDDDAKLRWWVWLIPAVITGAMAAGSQRNVLFSLVLPVYCVGMAVVRLVNRRRGER